MYGAIIGDIIGQPYEWHNIKTKSFPLFSEAPHFTDDSVMTIAVCDGILKAGINASKKEMKNRLSKICTFGEKNIPMQVMAECLRSGFRLKVIGHTIALEMDQR